MAAFVTLPDQVCVGSTIEFGTPLASNQRAEWTAIRTPAACQPDISSPGSALTDIEFLCVGTFEIQRCVYTQTEDAPPDPIEPTDQISIGCPLSMLAGESINVSLFGCENGTVDWTITGDALFTPTSNTGGIVTANGAGIVDLSVICTSFDADGNETIQEASCQFEVFEQDQEVICFTAEPFVINAVSCGEICECQTCVVVVEDCQEECIELSIGFVAQGCKDCEGVQPEPVPFTLTGLGGSDLPPIICDDEIDFGCDLEDPFCCDEHQPAILWNDASNCGWTFTATNAVNGSDISMAFACNIGQQFCFEGSTQILAQGDNLFIDTLVLYGLTMEPGMVTTSPLTKFGGEPLEVNPITDDACIGGYSIPPTVYFDQVDQSIDMLMITIEGEPGQIYCIDTLFLGRKLFLPDNAIPQPWTNPFRGMDREVSVKYSDCGYPISAYSTKKESTLNLNIRCISEQWAKQTLAPLMRYLECPNPLLFAWSINNCPHEIFYGYVEKNEGSTYNNSIYQQTTITAKGWIKQQQPKDFSF
jgi:hypothetical protein